MSFNWQPYLYKVRDNGIYNNSECLRQPNLGYPNWFPQSICQIKFHVYLKIYVWCHIYDFKNFSSWYLVFSSPEPEAQVSYCDRASSVRPFGVNFDIVDFFSETTLHNSTKLDRKQDLNVLYNVCVFPADQKNKMAARASDWLRHFPLLLWYHWTGFNEICQEARSTSSFMFVFCGSIGKQDGHPGLQLAWTFSISPRKPLNGIQRNLTESKISTSSTMFVFFRPIWKTRWRSWPLIGWDIFHFSSEQNSRKLASKQYLNVLYQVCVFRANRKNKMATYTSDWLRHFWLFLWNPWTPVRMPGV